MTVQSFNCGKNHQQYRIIAACKGSGRTVALAGFCAEEQAEDILFRHLQNLCVQSDGSLSGTHSLLCQTFYQWRNHFDIPAAQLLQLVSTAHATEQLSSVCLYKTAVGQQEALINRIML
jgi:hypothetical protein